MPVIIVIAVFFLVSPCYCQLIRLGVDYLYEKRPETEETSEYRFTQIYDVILEKSVRPLYDLQFKIQFRSEKEEDTKNRVQNLPSVALHLGNQVLRLDSGYSKDSIREQDLNYDLARGYSTFIWKPFYLPKITVQYQTEDKDLDEKEDSGREKRLILRDDYRLAMGIFVLSHSFAIEKREVTSDDTGDTVDYDNHDLNNRGQINYQFSAFDSRLQVNSDYELSHNEKQDEEANNTYRSLEQKANLRFHVLPGHDTAVYYNLFLGEIQKMSEHDRERSVGNSIKTEFLPLTYLKTTLEASHDNHWDSQDDIRNSVLTYGLRLEPEIPGLFLALPMPPLKTSLLLSSSLNEINGEPDYRMNSALLKGSTEIYHGVEIRTDFELINAKDYNDHDEKWEKDIKFDASFDLRQDLKYYFRNENDWISIEQKDQEGERTTVDTFDGEIWHLITYRPADQLFLTFDNKLTYGDTHTVTYSYRVGWVPVPKLRLEAQYQSSDTNEEKYFSSEMNFNITKTLKFRFKYTYPSDDQVVSFRFTLKT
ncbi:MAG: hypothetical protein AB1847_01935 [bacterium]